MLLSKLKAQVQTSAMLTAEWRRTQNPLKQCQLVQYYGQPIPNVIKSTGSIASLVPNRFFHMRTHTHIHTRSQHTKSVTVATQTKRRKGKNGQCVAALEIWKQKNVLAPTAPRARENAPRGRRAGAHPSPPSQ